jgi:hypothetical protein
LHAALEGNTCAKEGGDISTPSDTATRESHRRVFRMPKA